ncbi:MAG: type II toxin-antitoxin system HicB family antitoxin [Clostridiales bacterium]|nr:type II toxin-antitoxin system HicB family antitoxin [Clostridiales bacterium]
MGSILKYKGYFTKIEYDVEDKILYGKIEGIKDLVTFESESAALVEQEFHKAVDDYLELCKELNQEPDKVYSGTFNVRVEPELHRAAAMEALKSGTTLNNTVEQALREYIERLHKTAKKAMSYSNVDLAAEPALLRDEDRK